MTAGFFNPIPKLGPRAGARNLYMNLRERLLALLSEPGYRPANETELSRRLGLGKKQRGPLAHELGRLLGDGNIVRVPGNRVKLRVYASAAPKPSSSRPIFVPGSRHAPSPATGPGEPNKRPGRVEPATGGGPGELLGRIQFRAGGSAFVIPEGARDPEQTSVQIFPEDTGVALPGDRVAVLVHKGRKGRRTGETVGRVLRVVERGRDTIVGELRRSGRNFHVAPDDPRFVYQILVPDPAKSGVKPVPAPGDKVVVRLASWERRNDPLTGELTARLGRTFEPRAELLGVFTKFDLDPTFPAEVEREVADLPDTVQPRELANRLDYRQVPVFTIDPDDAKDFDDALSIETLDGGDTRVGIHIADVSTYVKTGTALDREAQKRGNSTYLVGTVIPMLPEKLSNGLCSLVEAQDRLCKATFLIFAQNGRLKDTTFANTVIRSRKRLTYKQAYALLFENDLERIRALPLPPKHQTGSTGRALSSLSDLELVDLQSWVRKLWTIARRLRSERMAHGSLDLDMPETKVFVDAEGYADRLERIEHDESHQLIEEFMLAANEAVARLTRIHKLPSLYRVHDDPDDEKLAEYRQLLGTFHIQVGDLTHRAEVVKLLETLRTHPQGYTLRTQLLRSLKKACYRATPDGHYGLHKKDYTHFTSPIRRYSDLVVHRVFDFYLIKHAGHPAPIGQSPGYNLARMEALAEHLSLTEVNSAEAERESVKIKLLEFFEREAEKKKKTVFTAVITDVRPHGFFIELLESMTFGLVPASTLTDDQYVLNAAGTALIGRRHKRRYELNGRLEVNVDKVDRFKRTIDFRPVSA
jgi:ribonuclease R